MTYNVLVTETQTCLLKFDTKEEALNPIFNQNPVTGKTNGLYCDNTRKYHGCGMEGKYFEAK